MSAVLSPTQKLKIGLLVCAAIGLYNLVDHFVNPKEEQGLPPICKIYSDGFRKGLVANEYTAVFHATNLSDDEPLTFDNCKVVQAYILNREKKKVMLESDFIVRGKSTFFYKAPRSGLQLTYRSGKLPSGKVVIQLEYLGDIYQAKFEIRAARQSKEPPLRIRFRDEHIPMEKLDHAVGD